MEPGDLQLVEDAVRFPPPMMLGLRELGLAIMAIEIRIQCIVAIANDSPKRIIYITI